MSIASATARSAGASRLHIVLRVAAAVFGGYIFAWGIVAAVTSLLFAADVEFHDAEFVGALAGLLAYLGVFLWALAARGLAAVWLVLVGGGALLAAVASLVQSLLF
jgi:hypothetical protein